MTTIPIHGPGPSFLSTGRLRRAWWLTGFPLLVAGTLVLVLLFSGVALDLYILDGLAAQTIVGTYVALLVVLSVIHFVPWLHTAGALLGSYTFAARAGGFLDLVLSDSRWDLIAAVGERTVLVASVVMWHVWGAWRATLDREARALAAARSGDPNLEG